MATTYDPRTIERTQGTQGLVVGTLGSGRTQGFVIPQCECGHKVGDHVTATGGLSVHHGPCYECDCTKYRETRP